MKSLTIAVLLIVSLVLTGCSSMKNKPSFELLDESDVMTRTADDQNFLLDPKEPVYVEQEEMKLWFGLKFQIPI
jgi:PBP1b-binding outer membrane lipoprotein LpoB